MGVGFAAAAAVEFGLALAVLLRPMRLVSSPSSRSPSRSSGLYAYDVAIGLPFGGADQQSTAVDDHEPESAGHGGTSHEEGANTGSGHRDEGLVVGSGEPIDALGAMTSSARSPLSGWRSRSYRGVRSLGLERFLPVRT